MATAFKQQKNGAVSLLASAMTTGATSAVVTTGTGVKFPVTSGGSYYVTIWSGTITNPLNDTNMEIVLVTALTTDTFTVTRSQLGTNPSSTFTHAIGDNFQILIQDQNFLDIQAAINNIESGATLPGLNGNIAASYLADAGVTTCTTVAPTYGLLKTFTFTTMRAANVVQVLMRCFPMPTVASTNGLIKITYAVNGGSDTDFGNPTSIHSGADADWVINKNAQRFILSNFTSFAGGTIVIKVWGRIEGAGQSFQIGNSSDDRWSTNVNLLCIS